MTSPLQFATLLAHQAGELLRDYYSTNATQATLKPDHSIVTEADLASDRLIAKQIKKRFPGDILLSEELQPEYIVGGDPAPDHRSPDPGVWVIDPLDGTTNFSLGLHYWGVSIARLVDGWPEIAAMYYPLLDQLYTAQKGAGAYLNGEPLHNLPPPEGQTSFFACCSRTYRRYDVNIRYKTRILGCASYMLCAVALGIAAIGLESTAKIWDLAGGWLLVQEAGGVVGTLEGTQPFPLATGDDYRQKSFPILAAATRELAYRARDQIQLKKQTQSPA